MGKNFVVILSAGSGNRYSADKPKQFVKVAGKTLIEHTIDVFEKSSSIDEIIIVSNPSFVSFTEELVLKNDFLKVRKILSGGDTRRKSSTIGVNSIDDDNANVLIHDAVMPFTSDAIIKNCIAALEKHVAVDVAIPSVDTIIRVNSQNYIEEIPDRRYLMRGLTPQCFKVGVIKEAHRRAEAYNDTVATDDCSLILKHNLGKVFVVKGEKFSLKITNPEDIHLADKLFQLVGSHYSEDFNFDKLKNKVLVVFGASRGIGKSVIEHGIKNGAHAYGFSRKNGVDIRSNSKVAEALKEVYSEEGKIDYIVVTSAVLHSGKLPGRSFEDIEEEIQINFIAPVNIIKESHRYIRETKGGIILFTGAAYTRGRALYSVYTATKAAIANLVQGLSEEFISEGVKVNAISPERVAGPMRQENFGAEPSSTLIDPGRVAQITLSVLLSDMTGQIIDIKKSS